MPPHQVMSLGVISARAKWEKVPSGNRNSKANSKRKSKRLVPWYRDRQTMANRSMESKTCLSKASWARDRGRTICMGSNQEANFSDGPILNSIKACSSIKRDKISRCKIKSHSKAICKVKDSIDRINLCTWPRNCANSTLLTTARGLMTATSVMIQRNSHVRTYTAQGLVPRAKIVSSNMTSWLSLRSRSSWLKTRSSWRKCSMKLGPPS